VDVADAEWADVLSLGEQQRVAFARLLVSAPAFAILDEATSSLDQTRERELYGAMIAAVPDAVIISIAHRVQALLPFHTHVLEVSAGDGGSNWSMMSADEFSQRANIKPKPPETPVTLHVYDLNAGHINAITGTLGLGGVYHAGVEVFGVEWTFGSGHPDGGVYPNPPRQSTKGNLVQSLPLGPTALTCEEVTQELTRLAVEWPASKYHLTRSNCVHFCEAFVGVLKCRAIPTWVNRLAKTGSMINIPGIDVRADYFDDEGNDETKVTSMEVKKKFANVFEAMQVKERMAG
jgi:energy-coupling factor transporter ATP-binding protein EcfA2